MSMTKNKVYLFSIIAIILQVAFDQYSKYLAICYLKGAKGIILIDGILQLLYVENRGAAFGVLQNSIVFFCIVTACILAGIVFVYIRMPLEKKYAPLFVLLSFLTAGAVGNLIDRIVSGFVVDFIYFSLIDFPVFNVADIYITVSTALIILLSLFKYREDEFAFLRFKKPAALHEQELLKKDFSSKIDKTKEKKNESFEDKKDSNTESVVEKKTDKEFVLNKELQTNSPTAEETVESDKDDLRETKSMSENTE